jgi:nucleotidyltransferase substrate binding protein (TIGR01987 family)
MEKLAHKIQSAEKALVALNEVLDFGSNVVFRDAAIHRFEFTVEAVWKALKLYLQDQEGVMANSPKAVFREALVVGLINEEETKEFLGMIEARNSTDHTYNEVLALTIAKEIPKYYGLMMRLMEVIKKTYFVGVLPSIKD